MRKLHTGPGERDWGAGVHCEHRDSLWAAHHEVP